MAISANTHMLNNGFTRRRPIETYGEFIVSLRASDPKKLFKNCSQVSSFYTTSKPEN